jgi:hypothetical protein
LNSIKETLITNTWQENLNTWIFRETVIQIKNYAHQDITRLIEYSIEQSFDGQFILKTSKAVLGDLYLEVNYKNPLPRIVLRSKPPEVKYLELQAYNKFSNEQKSLIHSRINSLRQAFETQKQALIRKAAPAKSSEPATLKIDESSLLNIGTEIDRLAMIVETTMNVASDFQAYYEQIDADVSKLEAKINAVCPTLFKR